MKPAIILDDKQWVAIEDIALIAKQQQPLELSDSEDFIQKINQGAAFIDSLLEEEGCVYGVTTGYGDSCTVPIPLQDVSELSKHLFTFHGCGLGAFFSPQQTRAILAARLVSLAQGFSGVRYLLLQRLSQLLTHDILPKIPQEGSVGASGDLTPLSYVAAVLAGEREVWHNNEYQAADQVLRQHQLPPLTLKPKEGLAIMNGTAVMTALACLAYQRAEYLSRLCSRITSLVSIATAGNAYHFDERLFQVKPHNGQQKIAARIRQDLHPDTTPRNNNRLQDRYSIRCAPHIIGVLEDALPFFRQLIENELNSANDNPIVDAEDQHILHGGHFYGGHIAFAMDSMKTAVANLADLLDRQMALLMDPKFNHGLAANLSGAKAEQAALNHGFKAVQIAVSAWAAEALKHTMPASVFSRSTECHNQDKVSMGTIAARDCLRIIELTEQCAAAMLIAAVQGVEMRKPDTLTANIQSTILELRKHIAFLSVDRALDKELRHCMTLIQNQHWPLYE